MTEALAKIKKEFKKVSRANLILYSLSIAYLVYYCFTLPNTTILPVEAVVYLLILGMMFLPISFAVNVMANKLVRNRKEDGLLGLFAALMVVFLSVTIPLITYWNNPGEFGFSAGKLIYVNLLFLAVAIAVFPFILLIRNRRWIWTIFLGLCFGIIVQTLFFNRYLGQIGVSSFRWKAHILFSVIDLVVWVVLFGVGFFVVFKTSVIKDSAVVLVIALAVGQVFFLAISGISYLNNPLRTEKKGMYDAVAFEGEEQFVVASKENVIVIIIDAVDNSVLKEIKEERPDLFGEFADFTMYTNTNSVFDLTHYCMRLLFTGQMLGSDTYKGDVFFSRIHNAGFKVHFYGYDGFGTNDAVFSYIDNCVTGDVSKYMTKEGIKKKELIRQEIKLVMYQVLPSFLKQFADSENINFERCVIIPYVDYNYYIDNKGFREHVALTVNEEYEKYFIMEYMLGAHFPCDDIKGETVYCLEAVGEYIEELKRLGCYDNSTIIVMSDHGMHDDDDSQGIVFPTAATPMFLIKEKNVHHDAVSMCSAPISYEDFQATILENMGLYEAGDETIFPASIYRYSEGDSRMRVWYDSNFSNIPSLKFTFDGDTSELEKVVEENCGEEVGYYP